MGAHPGLRNGISWAMKDQVGANKRMTGTLDCGHVKSDDKIQLGKL